MMEFKELRTNAILVADKCKKFASNYNLNQSKSLFANVEKEMREHKLAIMVVGEARRGKSSLLSALLGDDAFFPVDIDVTTCIVTMVSYGEKEKITVVIEDKGGKEHAEEINRQDIATYAKEQNRDRVAGTAKIMIIETPNPKLKSGMVFIDTPGIGSLNPMHSRLTYQFLPRADIVLFVTEATAPITDSELSFLKSVERQCNTILFVLTKKDLAADYEQIVTANRKTIAEKVGIPEKAQQYIAISSRMMKGYYRTGNREYFADSNFEQMDHLIQQMVVINQPRIILQPRVAEMQQELTRVEQTIIVEEAAYKHTHDEVQNLSNLLVEQKKNRQQLTSNYAKWKIDCKENIRAMSQQLTTMLTDFVREMKAYISTCLQEDMYKKNPSLLINELQGRIEQQMRLMSEFTQDSVTRLRNDFVQASGLNLAIENAGLTLQPGNINTVTVQKLKITDRLAQGGRSIGQSSYGFGMVGTVAGGILGAIGGFFVAGPAGAALGWAAGMEIGRTTGNALGSVKGTIQAIQRDGAYNILQLETSLGKSLNDTAASWNGAQKDFILNTQRSFVEEITKTINESIHDLDGKIEVINRQGKAKANDAKQMEQSTGQMRIAFDPLIKDCEYILNETKKDGEADPSESLFGFENVQQHISAPEPPICLSEKASTSEDSDKLQKKAEAAHGQACIQADVSITADEPGTDAAQAFHSSDDTIASQTEGPLELDD